MLLRVRYHPLKLPNLVFFGGGGNLETLGSGSAWVPLVLFCEFVFFKYLPISVLLLCADGEAAVRGLLEFDPLRFPNVDSFQASSC